MEDGPRRRAGALTAELRRELEALRTRAYSPEADIHQDPLALARLAELEDALRSTTEREAPTADAPSDRPVAGSSPVSAIESPLATASRTSPENASARPVVTGPGRASRRRRPAQVWALSLVAGLVVAAGATSAVVAAVAGAGDVRQVATLAEEPDFQPPMFMDADGATVRGFADFHGMVVMASSQPWLGPGTDECVVVTAGGDISNESQTFQGRMFVGCGAGEFPAAAQFTVAPGLPRDLISRYPVGTSLQFVLDGDRVGVFVGETSTVQAQEGASG